ncbi:hypothetical protein KSB_02480 [Ktedonobacter robiniae]|uniref:Uncharacterized protein n=1 Tax=Ktedonobacter robiniae TaxID=2778365 RepID=A0ABQ3UGD7_9CHLR|nr:hypothetical protein KSB_02480 [Ktedonobacter robiniae]
MRGRHPQKKTAHGDEQHTGKQTQTAKWSFEQGSSQSALREIALKFAHSPPPLGETKANAPGYLLSHI